MPYLFYSLYTKISSQLERGLMSRREKTIQVIQDTIGKWLRVRDWGFPCGSAGKESACNAGDLGSIPGLGRSPGEGKGYSLQYSGLKNSMDCIFHGIPKSWTQLSDFHFQRRLRVGKSFWASCGFFFVGRSGLQQTVTKVHSGPVPTAYREFHIHAWWAGGEISQHERRKRWKTRTWRGEHSQSPSFCR